MIQGGNIKLCYFYGLRHLKDFLTENAQYLLTSTSHTTILVEVAKYWWK